MTKRTQLGEFEHLLLLAVLRLGNTAYGATMRREIEERASRRVTLGSIYPTMDRLERKGYVTSRMGEPTRERGGRSRRYFALTPAGHGVLREARAVFEAMWEGFEPDSKIRT